MKQVAPLERAEHHLQQVVRCILAGHRRASPERRVDRAARRGGLLAENAPGTREASNLEVRAGQPGKFSGILALPRASAG